MYRSLPLLILCAAEFLTVIFSFPPHAVFQKKNRRIFPKENRYGPGRRDGGLQSCGDVGLQAAGGPLRADGGSRLSAAQRERKRKATAGEPGRVRGKSVFFPDFCSSLRHRPDQTDTDPGVRLFFPVLTRDLVWTKKCCWRSFRKSRLCRSALRCRNGRIPAFYRTGRKICREMPVMKSGR